MIYLDDRGLTGIQGFDDGEDGRRVNRRSIPGRTHDSADGKGAARKEAGRTSDTGRAWWKAPCGSENDGHRRLQEKFSRITPVRRHITAHENDLRNQNSSGRKQGRAAGGTEKERETREYATSNQRKPGSIALRNIALQTVHIANPAMLNHVERRKQENQNISQDQSRPQTMRAGGGEFAPRRNATAGTAKRSAGGAWSERKCDAPRV